MKLIVAIICMTVSTLSSGQTIKGKVVDRNRIINFALVQLLDSNGTSRDSQHTDIDGRFKFINVAPGNYALKVRCAFYIDTIFQNIRISKSIKLKLDIREFCKYDAAINNNTCPECHKYDEAIPIIYGLPVSINGEDPMKNEGKTWKSAGCVISNCDPHWYCKRDKTEF